MKFTKVVVTSLAIGASVAYVIPERDILREKRAVASAVTYNTVASAGSFQGGNGVVAAAAAPAVSSPVVIPVAPVATSTAAAAAATVAPIYVTVTVQGVGAAPVSATPVATAVATTAYVAPVATTAAAAAVAATTSAAASDNDSIFASAKSLFSFLFGDSSSSSATATTTTAAAVAAVSKAAVATTAAATTTSTSSSGWRGLLDSLFGISSGTSSTASTVAVSTAAVPVASSIVATSAYVAPAASSYVYSTLKTSYVSSAASVATGAGGYSGASTVDSSAAAASTNTGSISAASGAKGITYSPYQKNNACKTAAMVKYDISQLTDYDIIRLYSTDCSGVENVLASMTSSQQLFLGIWNIDSASVQSGLAEIKSAVGATTRGWSAVHTIAIGNEQVNAGTASVSQVAAGVSAARTWLKSNAPSYTGYIVTVDTLVAVVANTGLCSVSDYLAVNSHPYWDGNVQASNSGPWLQQQISNLESACGSSKSILITETGWPTQGQSYGSCVPSVANQKAALTSIIGTLGSQVLAFTMYNDFWKDPGPYGVEQYWGIFGNPEY